MTGSKLLLKISPLGRFFKGQIFVARRLPWSILRNGGTVACVYATSLLNMLERYKFVRHRSWMFEVKKSVKKEVEESYLCSSYPGKCRISLAYYHAAAITQIKFFFDYCC